MKERELIEIADEIVHILTTSVGEPAKAVYDEVAPLCDKYVELRFPEIAEARAEIDAELTEQLFFGRSLNVPRKAE